MLKLFKIKNKKVSIKDHYSRRNKVLIKRRAGGFGDIVMQRMLIEDFSKTGLEIHYCCPHNYISIMEGHPFLKELKELSYIKEEEYGIVYDITTICAVTESVLGSKNTKHRSDIWANHCGVELTNHETYLKSDQKNLITYKEKLKNLNTKNQKIVFISTKSAKNDFGEAKSLSDDQVIELVNEIKKLDYLIVTSNEEFQEVYSKLGIKQFVRLPISEWIALIDCCDYVVSIDTASFHIAGALKKPLLGIFSFTDGKIYGKYYDFILVQKHRDNGDWPCGPCYCYNVCPKEKIKARKPCITELSTNDILMGFKNLIDRTERIINL